MKRPVEREAVFQLEFRQDLYYWIKTERKIATRVMDLVEAIMRDPFVGIGKPEPLSKTLSGIWSRRITSEHRMLYTVHDAKIEFLNARYHY